MKNKILILSPLLLTFFIYFASCCKEDICVNKLAGKYKCDVSEYSYSSSEPDIPLANSTIMQEVSIVDDSTLLLKVTIGDTPEAFDTIDILQINNDTISFNNINHLVLGNPPDRIIHGFCYKHILNFKLALIRSPSHGQVYYFNGKKKMM